MFEPVFFLCLTRCSSGDTAFCCFSSSSCFKNNVNASKSCSEHLPNQMGGNVKTLSSQANNLAI